VKLVVFHPSVASLSLQARFLPLPVLLVIGALALIISNNYVRNKKNNRERRENHRTDPEDASEE
jgi:hypothetical protein